MVIDQLHKWIAQELSALDIKTVGVPTPDSPVVYVSQFSSTPSYSVKQADDYDVSLLLEVNSRSTSRTEAYDIAAKLTRGIDLDNAPFGVNYYAFTCSDGVQEMDDVGILQTQPIRLEMNITLKLN